MQRVMDALQRIWGYDTLRPLQHEAIEQVLAGRDSVTILPTGGGKSLCFQLPAVVMDGMAVVVSPLIALMKDQVDGLDACGVPAACINSMLTERERYTTDRDIRAGRIKVLYVTPERLAQQRFIDYLRRYNVSFIAIDEAHCISMWGHDFRPEYRTLKNLREVFPGVGIHAYTATATPQVRDDIVRELALNDPAVHVGNFDRPNLVYRIQQRTELVRQVCGIIEQHQGDAGIIYCIRRKDVDGLAQTLTQRGYRALPYHAGLEDGVRKANQEAFIREEADIIVATVAFGMGIDKSNVRYVIHGGMPKSLEHYQQESGRAGRDGLEAECVLLYGPADYNLWQRIIADSEQQGAQVALEKLRALYNFCTGATCRHRDILDYFGQRYDKDDCGACDVCLGEIEVMDGASEAARHICAVVHAIDGGFGGQYVARLLAGEHEDRTSRYGHDLLPNFGALSPHKPPAIRTWVEQLVAQGYLEKQGEYQTVGLTSEGLALLDNASHAGPRLLEPAKRHRRARKSAAPEQAWEGVHRDLFEALRDLRRQHAQAIGKPPYIIFGDRTLRDLAQKRPTTEATMLQCHGVGQRKFDTYGDMFLEAIRDFCRDHGLETNVGIYDLT